jgi:transposase InsO family protein
MLEVPEGSYFAWRKRTPSSRVRVNQKIVEQLLEISRRSRGAYGSRRSVQALRSAGVFVNRKRVVKLMRSNGITPIRRKGKPPLMTGETDIKNVLDRKFNVTEPNRYWASDITNIATKQGWLYLAVTMDLYSRRIIGWSMDRVRSAKLVYDALSAAIQLRRPKAAFVHHSDRGTQYTSAECQGLLARWGGIPSFSRKGNCWDNAVVESFFATLKGELVNGEVYRTRDEAAAAIFDYIEGWYNPERLHSTLGYKSPIKFEQLNHNA